MAFCVLGLWCETCVFFCVLGSTRYIPRNVCENTTWRIPMLLQKLSACEFTASCSWVSLSAISARCNNTYAKYPVLSSVTVKLHISPILHTALILSLSLLTVLLYSIALSPQLPYDCGKSLRIGPLHISMEGVILGRIFHIEQVGILFIIFLSSGYSMHNLLIKWVFCA